MKIAHRFGPKKTMTAPVSAFGLLSQNPLFSDLPEDVRRSLVAKGSLVRIPKYSLLFHQGDDITAVYLILEGLVKVYRDLGESDRTLGFLYKADIVGLDALYASSGHPYSVQALGNVAACAFPRETLMALVVSVPEFGATLLKAAAVQFETILHEQDIMSHRGTNGRIADKILTLTEKFGKPVPDGLALMLRVTQRELASMAATNRESVCKALLMFKREGSIDIQNKLIVIKNKSQLASWP